ncbi:hypothetical protein D3C76_974120 [compost metagenome]
MKVPRPWASKVTGVTSPLATSTTSTTMSPSGMSYTDSNLLSIVIGPPLGHWTTVERKSSSPVLTAVVLSPKRISRSMPINDGRSAAWLARSAARLYQRSSCSR